VGSLIVFVLAFQAEGDEGKFEALYAKYKRLMLYKAYGILRDPMLAEDAVSEAFVRVYKNIGKVGDPDSGRSCAFVVTIARNCALTMLAKQGRGRTEELLEETAASGEDLESSVVARLSAQEILRLVDSLGETDRDIFLLKYAHGLSHQEIGKALGFTENNVTVRLHRAKRRLRALVAERGLAQA
jgi:RNA polymerase sigma-70 factor (ECF subfamily)